MRFAILRNIPSDRIIENLGSKLVKVLVATAVPMIVAFLRLTVRIG
jgi:hypothetical protein